MDIYKVDENDGHYIARSLEALRCKKRRGKVAVKCNTAPNNNQARRFRSLYLLEQGTANILNEAKGFYILIGDDNMSLNMTFDDCNVTYYIGNQTDWKLMDLIIKENDASEIVSLHETKKAIGKADAIAFYTIFEYAYMYGYSTVFSIDSSSSLYNTVSDKIAECRILGNEFGVENKIVNLISKTTMKKEFIYKLR
jgi:hypothetical protein